MDLPDDLDVILREDLCCGELEPSHVCKHCAGFRYIYTYYGNSGSDPHPVLFYGRCYAVTVMDKMLEI